MAPRPQDDDDRVTDLRRYRKAREEDARRRRASKPARGESFLGSNPRAGLILVIVVVVLIALFVVPRFL